METLTLTVSDQSLPMPQSHATLQGLTCMAAAGFWVAWTRGGSWRGAATS